MPINAFPKDTSPLFVNFRAKVYRSNKAAKLLITFLISLALPALAQTPDSTFTMKEVTVESKRIMDGIGQMADYHDGVIYAGMKNEVLDIDSLDANKAINNTRQIIGRIPGQTSLRMKWEDSPPTE